MIFILPQGLRDNFNQALDKFNKITDYAAEENYDLFTQEDNFVDDNAASIKNILADYIKTVEE